MLKHLDASAQGVARPHHGVFASRRFRRDVDRFMGSLCALETGGVGSFRRNDADRIARVSDAVIEAIERRLLVVSGKGRCARDLCELHLRDSRDRGARHRAAATAPFRRLSRVRLVPGVGIEPTRPEGSGDFKSPASTGSATPAHGHRGTVRVYPNGCGSSTRSEPALTSSGVAAGRRSAGASCAGGCVTHSKSAPGRGRCPDRPSGRRGSSALPRAAPDPASRRRCRVLSPAASARRRLPSGRA